jgi:hypothetical protein
VNCSLPSRAGWFSWAWVGVVASCTARLAQMTTPTIAPPHRTTMPMTMNRMIQPTLPPPLWGVGTGGGNRSAHWSGDDLGVHPSACEDSFPSRWYAPPSSS